MGGNPLKSFIWQLWFNRVTLSFWALRYCMNVKNTEDVRNCITNPYAASSYCFNSGKCTPDKRLSELSGRNIYGEGL